MAKVKPATPKKDAKAKASKTPTKRAAAAAAKMSPRKVANANDSPAARTRSKTMRGTASVLEGAAGLASPGKNVSTQSAAVKKSPAKASPLRKSPVSPTKGSPAKASASRKSPVRPSPAKQPSGKPRGRPRKAQSSEELRGTGDAPVTYTVSGSRRTVSTTRSSANRDDEEWTDSPTKRTSGKRTAKVQSPEDDSESAGRDQRRTEDGGAPLEPEEPFDICEHYNLSKEVLAKAVAKYRELDSRMDIRAENQRAVWAALLAVACNVESVPPYKIHAKEFLAELNGNASDLEHFMRRNEDSLLARLQSNMTGTQSTSIRGRSGSPVETSRRSPAKSPQPGTITDQDIEPPPTTRGRRGRSQSPNKARTRSTSGKTTRRSPVVATTVGTAEETATRRTRSKSPVKAAIANPARSSRSKTDDDAPISPGKSSNQRTGRSRSPSKAVAKAEALLDSLPQPPASRRERSISPAKAARSPSKSPVRKTSRGVPPRSSTRSTTTTGARSASPAKSAIRSPPKARGSKTSQHNSSVSSSRAVATRNLITPSSPPPSPPSLFSARPTRSLGKPGRTHRSPTRDPRILQPVTRRSQSPRRRHQELSAPTSPAEHARRSVSPGTHDEQTSIQVGKTRTLSSPAKQNFRARSVSPVKSSPRRGPVCKSSAPPLTSRESRAVDPSLKHDSSLSATEKRARFYELIRSNTEAGQRLRDIRKASFENGARPEWGSIKDQNEKMAMMEGLKQRNLQDELRATSKSSGRNPQSGGTSIWTRNASDGVHTTPLPSGRKRRSASALSSTRRKLARSRSPGISPPAGVANGCEKTEAKETPAPGRGNVISATNPETVVYGPHKMEKKNPFFETMPAPEIWHRRMPPYLPFGETPFMERVLSNQISRDLHKDQSDADAKRASWNPLNMAKSMLGSVLGYPGASAEDAGYRDPFALPEVSDAEVQAFMKRAVGGSATSLKRKASIQEQSRAPKRPSRRSSGADSGYLMSGANF